MDDKRVEGTRFSIQPNIVNKNIPKSDETKATHHGSIFFKKRIYLMKK